jgi:hypothetical protein
MHLQKRRGLTRIRFRFGKNFVIGSFSTVHNPGDCIFISMTFVTFLAFSVSICENRSNPIDPRQMSVLPTWEKIQRAATNEKRRQTTTTGSALIVHSFFSIQIGCLQ